MSLYHKAFKLFQSNYLMYAMLGVLVSSCFGAAASMLVLHKGHGFIEMFEVTIIVCACMGFNATILSDRKRELVFNLLIVSCIISILVLVLNLLF